MVSQDVAQAASFEIAKLKPSELTQLKYEDVKRLLDATKNVAQNTKVGITLNQACQWDLFKSHRKILEMAQPDVSISETAKIKARKDRTSMYKTVEEWLETYDVLTGLTTQFNRVHDGDTESFQLILLMRVLKFIENAEPFFLNIGGDSSGGKTSIYQACQRLLGYIPFSFTETTKEGKEIVHHCESPAFMITEPTPQGLFYTRTVEGQIIAIDEAFIHPELARQMRRCYVKNMVVPKDTVADGKGLELEIAPNTLFVTAAVDNHFNDPQDLNRRLFTSVKDLDKARSDEIKKKLSHRYRKDSYKDVTISDTEQGLIDALWSWIEDKYKAQVCVWCEIPTPYRDVILNPRQSEIYMSMILAHAFLRTIKKDEEDAEFYANDEDVEFATNLFKRVSYSELKETVNLNKTQKLIADWVRSHSQENCKRFGFEEIAYGIHKSPAEVRRACFRDDLERRSFHEFKVTDDMGGYSGGVKWNG